MDISHNQERPLETMKADKKADKMTTMHLKVKSKNTSRVF